jgi:hypothetical protein
MTVVRMKYAEMKMADTVYIARNQCDIRLGATSSKDKPNTGILNFCLKGKDNGVSAMVRLCGLDTGSVHLFLGIDMRRILPG